MSMCDEEKICVEPSAVNSLPALSGGLEAQRLYSYSLHDCRQDAICIREISLNIQWAADDDIAVPTRRALPVSDASAPDEW